MVSLNASALSFPPLQQTSTRSFMACFFRSIFAINLDPFHHKGTKNTEVDPKTGGFLTSRSCVLVVNPLKLEWYGRECTSAGPQRLRRARLRPGRQARHAGGGRSWNRECPGTTAS